MKSFIFGMVSILFLLLCSVSVYADSTYVVQAGDTLYSISRKFDVSVTSLRKENNISEDNVIKVGQKLSIPEKASNVGISSATAVHGDSSAVVAKTGSSAISVEGKDMKRKFDVYTVQKGDTFYRIAKVNDITVSELKELNDLSEDSILKAGQKLKIPVSIVDSSLANLPDLPSNDPRTYSKKKGDSSLTWPVEKPEVTYIKGKVSGVHLSAKEKESVKCIRAGTVVYTGNYRGYGQVVFVQSKANYIYAYTGLESIKVKNGDYVVFGDVLGTAGTDSIKGTSQISFMVFNKSVPVDPEKAPRG
ncbi:MAG: M23 family metallopeptidase [Treponema sp.]|nr:M23 family metallopeptidase [Treponema sp.]